MDYGRIIRRALEITWRYKVLWIFALLVTLFGGFQGGNSGLSSTSNTIRYDVNSGDIQRWWNGLPGGPFGGINAPNWGAILGAIAGVLAVLVIIALILTIVGIIVRYTSMGAMIGMVDEVERGGDTSFRSGLSRGWSRFLRLFAINLLLGVATFIALIPMFVALILGVGLIVGPVVAMTSGGRALPPMGVLWIIIVALAMLALIIVYAIALTGLVTLLREYAFRACVIERRGVFDSLGMAWRLFRTRFGDSLLLWLFMVGINLAIGVVTIPLVLLGIGSIVVPALLVGGATRSVVGALIAAAPFLIVVAVVTLFLNVLYVTFYSSYWTLGYRELRGTELLAEPAI